MNDAEKIGQAFLALLQTMEKTPRPVKFRTWCNYPPGDVPTHSRSRDGKEGLTFDLTLQASWPSSKALLAGIWDGTMMGGRVYLDHDLDPAELADILQNTDRALRNTIELLKKKDEDDRA